MPDADRRRPPRHGSDATTCRDQRRSRNRGRGREGRRERGVSTPLGVVLLVAITAVTGAVAAGALASSAPAPAEPTPRAAFDLRVDARTDTVALVHAGGDPVDPARLELRIRVDGSPIVHQPPVPFFSARGFHSGPTGPFNRRWNGSWRVGVRAGLRLADTNTGIEPGDRVRVRLSVGDHPLAELNATA